MAHHRLISMASVLCIRSFSVLIASQPSHFEICLEALGQVRGWTPVKGFRRSKGFCREPLPQLLYLLMTKLTSTDSLTTYRDSQTRLRRVLPKTRLPTVARPLFLVPAPRYVFLIFGIACICDHDHLYGNLHHLDQGGKLCLLCLSFTCIEIAIKRSRWVDLT